MAVGALHILISMTARPLRLMVYDRTCRGLPLLPGLTHTWVLGAWLYWMMGRLDDWRGVESWEEALGWILERASDERIAEIQVWCHGQWGNARINEDILDVDSLSPGHPHHELLFAISRLMMKGADGLWWFRTCQTYGARAGHELAGRLTDLLGCRTAGHTFIIGPWQSGLHTLMPKEIPSWPLSEGIAAGTPKAPVRALWSRPGRPNSITCLHGRIPEGVLAQGTRDSTSD